jgi:hypothetical protein
MLSCRFSTLLAHKPNRNEPESDLRKAERVRVHRVEAAVILVVDNWERPFAPPTSPFVDSSRMADHRVRVVGRGPTILAGLPEYRRATVQGMQTP